MDEPQNWYHQASKRIECPVCGAAEGERCHENGNPILGSHAGRFQAVKRRAELAVLTIMSYRTFSEMLVSCGEGVTTN